MATLGRLSDPLTVGNDDVEAGLVGRKFREYPVVILRPGNKISLYLDVGVSFGEILREFDQVVCWIPGRPGNGESHFFG